MPDLAHATPELLAPVWRQLEPCVHEKHKLIASCLYLSLLESPAAQKMNAEELAALAVWQMQELSDEIGGNEPFYWPKGKRTMFSPRDLEIIDLVNRLGRFEGIGKRFGLTDMRCRQIYNDWRRIEVARRQGALFDTG